ncbi:PREDICTED: translation initiation factor IF-2-like [Chinchilla lanigera]|uniref:translation initiation factor IF-2-like n=1 Tax=Chinchilla lanigera TaxID=34839 RepID=UPI00038EED87|nr:PREDICTED: translation initiation factor IF-2-like [Chinchilla lanigera]
MRCRGSSARDSSRSLAREVQSGRPDSSPGPRQPPPGHTPAAAPALLAPGASLTCVRQACPPPAGSRSRGCAASDRRLRGPCRLGESAPRAAGAGRGRVRRAAAEPGRLEEEKEEDSELRSGESHPPPGRSAAAAADHFRAAGSGAGPTGSTSGPRAQSGVMAVRAGEQRLSRARVGRPPPPVSLTGGPSFDSALGEVKSPPGGPGVAPGLAEVLGSRRPVFCWGPGRGSREGRGGRHLACWGQPLLPRRRWAGAAVSRGRDFPGVTWRVVVLVLGGGWTQVLVGGFGALQPRETALADAPRLLPRRAGRLRAAGVMSVWRRDRPAAHSADRVA